MANLAILAAILALVSLVRVRITRLPITGPMVFVGIGMLLSPDALGLLDIELDEEGVILTAELTLGLLLFSDAARIDAATLRSAFSLPTRLLGLGLPLTIGLGTVMALVFLRSLAQSTLFSVNTRIASASVALYSLIAASRKAKKFFFSLTAGTIHAFH